MRARPKVVDAVAKFFDANERDLNVLRALVQHLELHVAGRPLTVEMWWHGEGELIGAAERLRRFDYSEAGPATEAIMGFEQRRTAIEAELPEQLGSRDDVVRLTGELACLHTTLHRVFHGERGDTLYLPRDYPLHIAHHSLLETLHMMSLVAGLEEQIDVFREGGFDLREIRAAAMRLDRMSERLLAPGNTLLAAMQSFGG